MYLCHGERTCRWVNLCEHADAMFESPNVTTSKTMSWYGQNKQYIQTNKQLITQNINVMIIIPRRNKTFAQYCMKFIIPELKQCITSQKRAIKIFLKHKKEKIQSGVTEKILEISWSFIWNSIIQLEIPVSRIWLSYWLRKFSHRVQWNWKARNVKHCLVEGRWIRCEMTTNCVKINIFMQRLKRNIFNSWLNTLVPDLCDETQKYFYACFSKGK